MADTVKVLDAPPEGEQLISQMETSVVREFALSDEREQELKAYIEDELNRAIGDRGLFDENLKVWQEIYDAPPNEEADDFPFVGASNITIPVIKEAVNTLTAQLTQVVITPSPRWVVRTDNNDWKKFSGIIERFLDRASREDMKIDANLETWILECVKYGTSILQVTYEKVYKDYMVFGRDGKTSWPSRRLVRQGPTVYNVPLQDFFIPFSSTDIQNARWVAKRIRLNGVELKRREKAGIFKNVDQVMQGNPTQEPVQGDLPMDEPVLEHIEESQKATPSIRDTYEIFEWWGVWDVRNDGNLWEVRVYYHLRSNTLLRKEFNPYWHGQRPFIPLRYFPIEYRFYGQGLCEQLEQIQEEITTIHKQRLDNATLANVRAYKVRKLSGALKPGDPIYGGQIIPVTEMDDVEPFQLGEVYPSSFENEMLARNYAERLSGVNDATMRGGQPVSRTTATAQLALLQEQSKRFDQTIRKIRFGLKELADFIFLYYFQFGIEPSKPVQWLGEKGKAISAIFSLPYETVDQGLGFEAAAPTSQVNKEQQRQQYLAVFNLLVQMYEKFWLLLGNIGVPPDILAIIAGSMARTSKDFLWQVLERMDVTNPDEALATLSVIERILPAPEALQSNEAVERRLADAEILEQIEELERTLLASGRTPSPDLRVIGPREGGE